MLECFGGEREISLCRELTKVHEEVRRTTLAEAVAFYQQTPPRGEFVLVVAGAVPREKPAVSLEEACEMVRQRIAGGEKRTQACKAVAAETGFRKNQLYDA